MKLEELFEASTQSYYAWAKDKDLDPQSRVTFKKFVRENNLTPAMEKRLEKDAKIGQKLNESTKTLYVYDSGKITELDPKDEVAMQRFNNKYGFHEDSLFDFPVEKGVRVFEVKGKTIVVSDDPNALAAEVEKRS